MRLGARILHSHSSTAHKICLFPTHKPRLFLNKEQFPLCPDHRRYGRCVCCCELVLSLLPAVQKASTHVTKARPKLHSWQLPLLSLLTRLLLSTEETHEALDVHFSSRGSQMWVGIRFIGRTYLNTDSRVPTPEFLFLILDGGILK